MSGDIGIFAMTKPEGISPKALAGNALGGKIRGGPIVTFVDTPGSLSRELMPKRRGTGGGDCL